MENNINGLICRKTDDDRAMGGCVFGIGKLAEKLTEYDRHTDLLKILSLSPPSYSVQEDPSSGDLRSRLQQIWPNRPEYGRYSLDYECKDWRRRKSENERQRKCSEDELGIAEEERAAAAGSSSHATFSNASDMILPCRNESVDVEALSEQLVQTSMLFSSTNKLNQAGLSLTTTTDDLLTLGGVLPTNSEYVCSNRSLTLVPSALLRSSCAEVNGTFCSSTISNAEAIGGNKEAGCYYAGSISNEEALDLLNHFPCIVFKDDCTNKVRVGLQVEDEGRLFDLEILSIEGGELMWQIRGTTFCLSFRSLDEMMRFYRDFPSTLK